MQQVKTLYQWIKKYMISIVISIVMLIVLSNSRVIVPQFISYAIDSILLGEESTFPQLFVNIVEQGSTPKEKLLFLSILLIVFQSVRAILMYGRNILAAHYNENIMFELREKVFNHLETLPFGFFKKNDAGDIIQRCTKDVDVVRTFISQEIPQAMWCIAIIISTVIVMFQVNPMFALISLSTMPIMFISSILYFRKIKTTFEIIDDNEGEMIDVIKENITGVQVVKAFGSQEYELEKYTEKSETLFSNLKIFFSQLAQLHSVNVFLATMQGFIVIIVGITFVDSGHVSIGELILFTMYVKLLSLPIRMLGRLLSRLGRNFVAIERIQYILDQEADELGEGFPKINGDINFKNVSFEYEDGNVKVLDNVSFTIEAGSKVAIVGKTGSGKSTIAHLLSRLFDPTEGSITIENNDLGLINKKHLRDNIGILVQEPYLFSKNIQENLSITNENLREEEIQEYAKVAHIHSDIANFPEGYNTIVGERGTTLSGGQKQRMAIARMLADQKKYIVFDDSLSAVDNETDRSIRKSIEKIKDVTIVIITHRLHSVLDADKVIVLEDGKVIEQGSIEELLSLNGYFKDMYDRQVGDNNE